jgi:uncharacterized alpha-E superfamily protein
MLARIAHELFWLGRHLGRAEHTARMLDGIYAIDLQAPPDTPVGAQLTWEGLLAVMGVEESPEAPDRDEVMRLLAVDETNQASVLACVEAGREGARIVRDVISAEMWEAVNTLRLGLRQRYAGALGAGPYAFLQYVKERCALFWGLAERTMLEDEARAFLIAGGRIEAAEMVVRMLRVALAPLGEEVADEVERPAQLDDAAAAHSGEPGWRAGGQAAGQALALLHAVGGLHAFRRAVTEPPNAEPVAGFLLYERAYPDSVGASVDALHAALVAADASSRTAAPVLRLARLSADIEFRRRSARSAGDLLGVLGDVQNELALVDHDIADRYFAGAVQASRVMTA